MKETLQFRPLTFDEFKILIQWAANEGWNPGLEDAELFWHTDPEGFYGYFEGDTLIGGGSIVSYNGQFGFMGFFIVHPDYRSKGLGRDLWYLRRDTLLSRLKPGATIGMDGILAMQPFYQKGGFCIAYRDERYEKVGTVYPSHPQITHVTPAATAAITAFDTAAFGAERPHFIKLWLNAVQSKVFTFYEGNALLGVAVIRPCQKGFRIGPLYAQNATVAAALYECCLTEGEGQPVYLDIPVTNPDAVALVQNYGATYVFECARMYYGKPPVTAIDTVYGIMSFELG